MIELLEKKPERFAEEVRKAAESEDFSVLLENARAGKNPVTVYAAAFLAMSRSMVRRATSARRRAISIGSRVTTGSF